MNWILGLWRSFTGNGDVRGGPDDEEDEEDDDDEEDEEEL